MNTHLSERLGRRGRLVDPERTSELPSRPASLLNTSIRKYVVAEESRNDISHWSTLPEFPATYEIFDEGRQNHEKDVEIDENIVVGPYPSKDDYLSRHYALLREDAISPLRDVVSEIQFRPNIMEEASENDAYVYEKVYITGYTFARSGKAVYKIPYSFFMSPFHPH